MVMRRLAHLILAAALTLPQATGAGPSLVCNDPGTLILVEQASNTRALDPASGSSWTVPVSPDAVEQLARLHDRYQRFMPGYWSIERIATGRGVAFYITETASAEPVMSAQFDRRIEIAAAVSTPDGRFTVHVQANNIASEVTVLDASLARRQLVTIPHNATLAAFSIGIAFSPGQSCVAISMERVGGPGAETWLVDMATGSVTTVPVPDAFVLDWVRGR